MHLLSGYCCIPLHRPIPNINRPKALAISENYHVIIATSDRVNRMARQWKKHTQRCTEGGSITARERMEGVDPAVSLLRPQYCSCFLPFLLLVKPVWTKMETNKRIWSREWQNRVFQDCFVRRPRYHRVVTTVTFQILTIIPYSIGIYINWCESSKRSRMLH